jgi:phospholipid/cholesterol/gamma-HCH transport system substrate-binding protein
MNAPANKRAIVVGLFIIIGLLFLVGGILTIGNLHSTFSKKISISTIFGDVNGLQAGNNIWFSGVKIGTVKKIEFYGESQVKVIMNINTASQQYIRKDARVKISTDGLIGNKILVIYGGTLLAPEVKEGDTLYNEKILSTEDIMSTLQKNNLNILVLTDKLAKGEGTIGKLLISDSIYNSIASTINSLKQASAKAQILISSLAEFSAKLNKKGSLANDLVTDTVMYNSVKASIFNIQGIADTASVFVNNLKEAIKNPTSPLGVLIHDEKTGANLKTTISNLKTSSEKINTVLDAIKHSFLFRNYFKKEQEKNGEIK